jgi:hypothetical protein
MTNTLYSQPFHHFSKVVSPGHANPICAALRIPRRPFPSQSKYQTYLFETVSPLVETSSLHDYSHFTLNPTSDELCCFGMTGGQHTALRWAAKDVDRRHWRFSGAGSLRRSLPVSWFGAFCTKSETRFEAAVALTYVAPGLARQMTAGWSTNVDQGLRTDSVRLLQEFIDQRLIS